MKFDQFNRTYEDIQGGGSTAGAKYQPVPDGEHEFEIKKIGTYEDKLIVTLATASGSFAWVSKFLDPAEERDHDLAVCLLHSLGLPEDTDIDESLVGRFVKAETKQGFKNGQPVLDKHGNQRVYVNSFWPSKFEQQSQKKPAARTPLQKAKAHAEQAGGEAGGDDIPF